MYMVYKLPGILAPVCPSHMPSLRAPLGKKWSGWQSRISWAYYPKLVKTNENARSVKKKCLSRFKHLYFFWAGFPQNASNIARLHCCKCPRNLTGPFLLVRGWGLGMCPFTIKFCYLSTLYVTYHVCEIVYQALPTFQHCKVTDQNGQKGEG